MIGVVEVIRSPFLERVLSRSEALRQMRVETDAEVAACDVVLVHAASDTRWQAVCALAQPSASCIRVSTVDQPAAPNPYVDVRGVRVLHLRPALHRLEEADWTTMLTTLVLGGCGYGELVRVLSDHGLAKYFVSRSLPHVESLFILCEGFLHAPEQRKTTQEWSWWAAPFVSRDGEDDVSLRLLTEEVGIEWRAAQGLNSAPVIELLEAIRQHQSLISDELVRRAYSALARCLEFAQRQKFPEPDPLNEADPPGQALDAVS
jgi:hypothetical protein